MFESLKDKKVLVTGASTGIGAAIAELFAHYGAHVGVHYRSSQKATEAVLKKVRNLSGWGMAFQGDLLESSIYKNLVRTFIDACGGIDVLVNNAGAIYDYIHFSQLQEESFDRTFTLNVKAPFYLIREAFSFMEKTGGGRIINITTASVKYGGSPFNIHYCASKSALDTLTIGFARAGTKYGILVNSIRCGLIATPMHTKIPGYSEDRFKDRISLIPLKRAGLPKEIARMVVFLASKGGDFITGQNFSVSGGD
ncbi:MAG: SDR family NAD(P)-dependent oxidoreductase [Promethearchaeota archaeon]|jgi:3-oxoacyl-[acyl-carrier protein] reductase